MMDSTKPVRWGVIGPGRIAATFAAALQDPAVGMLQAACSRDRARAQAFLDEHGGSQAFGSMAAFLQEAEVDAVYIATPHMRHAEDALACLEAGLPVLIEKPLATSEADASAVLSAAESSGLLAMEAMWTAFLPNVKRFLSLADQAAQDGPAVGHIDFQFAPDVGPDHRLRNAALAGGALLDVGVYALSMASWLLGQPALVASSMTWDSETGVDRSASVVLTAGERRVTVSFGMDVDGPRTVQWSTPRGRVMLGPDWFTERAVVTTEAPAKWDGRRPAGSLVNEEVAADVSRPGFAYQVEAFERALRAGRTNVPERTADDVRMVHRLMDELRASWGLRYPFEVA